MTTPKQHFEEFAKQFSTLTNQELIAAFNKEVGKIGWGGARAAYLSALQREFNIRNLDYSEIGDEEGLSFKSQVYLKENKILVNLLG